MEFYVLWCNIPHSFFFSHVTLNVFNVKFQYLKHFNSNLNECYTVCASLPRFWPILKKKPVVIYTIMLQTAWRPLTKIRVQSDLGLLPEHTQQRKMG
jgi:hypothetical protein